MRTGLVFLVLGSVLFLLTRALDPLGRVPAPALGADPAAMDDEELLYQAALAEGWVAADPVVERRLLRNMQFLQTSRSPDEIGLLGDAYRLGLDRNDLVVRRRLVERMRRKLLREAVATVPSEADLVRYGSAHSEEFALPERVRLSHVFFQNPHVPERLPAPELLLREGRGWPGNPHLVEPHLPLQSNPELARQFGVPFARATRDLPIGRWSEPLRSPQGLHLVWIHERRPEETPPFAQVRGQILATLVAQRQAASLKFALARLRARGSLLQ